MDFSHINPHVRVADLIFELEDYTLLSNLHYNYDCRIFYFIEGSGSCTIDNLNFKVMPNMIVYIPPGKGYSFQVSPDIKYYILNFDLTDKFSHLKESLGVSYETFDMSILPKYEMPEEFKRVIFHKSERLRESLKKCVEEFRNMRQYYRGSASASLKMCLVELMREIDLSYAHSVANKVTEFVRNNYANPYLSNKDIAVHFGYHPYYVSNLVKDATGLSLRQYIIKHRLREAKKLLTTTKLSMTDVAVKSGFQTVTYFNKQFKEHNGITPLTYRKIHKHM